MKIRAYKNENPLEELIDVLKKASRKGCDSVEIRLGFDEINKLLKELQWALSMGEADTPQTEMNKCYKCKWWNYSYGCSNKKGICDFESVADTPQTDVYDYKGNGKWERSE